MSSYNLVTYYSYTENLDIKTAQRKFNCRDLERGENQYYRFSDSYYCREMLVGSMRSSIGGGHFNSYSIDFTTSVYNENWVKEIFDKVAPDFSYTITSSRKIIISLTGKMFSKSKISLLLFLLNTMIRETEEINWDIMFRKMVGKQSSSYTSAYSVYGLKLILNKEFDVNFNQYDGTINGIATCIDKYIAENFDKYARDF